MPEGIPSEVVLRPYQEQAKAHILACKDRGLQRVLVVSPTGTGKTTLFSALIGDFERSYGESSLVLAHRRELLDQAMRRIGHQNPSLGVSVEGGGRRSKAGGRVVVASVQSVGRAGTKRLEGFEPGLMIVDECHHAAAEGYVNAMRRFGAFDGRCFAVGVTATPHRMDNKPLHGSDQAIFQEVAFSYTLREAVKDGWLADLKGYRVATDVDLSRVRVRRGDYDARQLQEAVNTDARNEVAFEHWAQVARDRRTIVFCTGVEHAEDVAKLFRARGVSAESVNGAMHTAVRAGVLRRFSRGETQVLTKVEVATEGVDIPEASCVLMLRPTQSWALYTQCIGRGLRVLPDTIDGVVTAAARRTAVRGSGKADCVVIDVVDNGLTLTPPKEEGLDPQKAERPSVAAVVGLPPAFDLEGHGVVEALEAWERLEPAQQAAMFRRPTKYEDLGATLTAVDLLAELSVPEGMAQVSRLAWMKVGDGLYLLPCGSSAREEHRTARLECDPLGRHWLTLESALRNEGPFDCGDELKRAFEVAERRLKDVWPFVGGLISAAGRWRNEPMTAKQREELLALGVERTMVDLIESAGKAWTLIQMKRREMASLR